MSPSLLSTSVFFFFLFLRTTTGTQLPSDVQSNLRIISDLLTSRQEQITQPSPLETDTDVTSEEDDANRSPLSDDARTDMWRRRLELCRSWLDQMSARHPKSKPKLFARLSRGRLDRMPLSYGKRSAREDPRTRVYSKDGYARVGRERLNRMPLTYGKRQVDIRALTDLRSKLRAEFENRPEGTDVDFSGAPKLSSSETVIGHFRGEPFTRAQRDRLNRMPLTYGKRLWSGYRDLVPYSRSERGRLDRMPLTYGKRSGVTTSHDCKEGVDFEDNTGSPRDINSVDENDNTLLDGEGRVTPSAFTPDGTSHWTEDETEQAEYENEVPLTRLPRSKLQSMPFSFGKRVGRISPLQGDEHARTDDVIQALKVGDFQNIERRSRMDRMPVNFGKRSKANTPQVKRLRLDRMPMAFGKRGDSGVRDSLLSSDSSVRDSLMSSDSGVRDSLMSSDSGVRDSLMSNLEEDLGEFSAPNYKEIFISDVATKGNIRHLDTRPRGEETVTSVESNASPAVVR
ncbi:unnamed protein product [Lymnaea stagnalis]|uniref:Uncharacterized protein n=1 Tax=Lymnaea stagnalis TaxID=6523 RepID=A0AAV2IDF3_LYMST